MKLTVGSLFAGIGWLDLGLERAGMEVKWQVENNDYCRRVLRKHWPHVFCYGDVAAVDWQEVAPVDLICGGFPCQPFSCAGKRRGKEDDRYLWPEVVRCVTALRPTWFLGENVPGIIGMALDQACNDLEGIGYTVWPVCLPACAVDAPHIRQRVWILAHAESKQGASQNYGKQSLQIGESQQVQPGRSHRREMRTRYWLPEPSVGRVADGIPARVDRLRTLGNAIVPQIAEAFGLMINDASLGGQ